MSELFIAFSNSLIALALCIAIGYVCRRTHILNDIHTQGMSQMLIKVAMPCTVFMSLMRPFTTALLLEGMATLVITTVVFLSGGLLATILARVLKSTVVERQYWRFGLTFGNVGFMGIPVIGAVFGHEGLFYVAMAMVVFNLLSFTIGIRMFSKSDSARPGFIKHFRSNPALIMTCTGFIFFLLGIRLPLALEGGISLIAGMTSPISMILIGAILAKQRLKDALSDIRTLPPNIVKLVAIPLLTLLALRWVLPNPIMTGVIVTMMAMPPAAATVIFAEQYGGDAVGAARFVVVGTILCIVTVPLISLLF